MSKVHIGLVCEDKNIEGEIKQACEEVGGSYVHQAKTIYELLQKLQLQKVQVVVLVLKAEAEANDFKAAYNFLRGRRDLIKTPICVLSESLKVKSPVLIEDPLVRAFPLAFGVFLAIHSILPLTNSESTSNLNLAEGWIRNEFLDSLKAKAGQNLNFSVRVATEDERRTAFFSERSDEVRAHLGWFKFTARMLESQKDNMSKMFKDMSRDSMEEFSQILLDQVVKEFNSKVESDFAARGAIYLPEMDQLSAAERKLVYGRAKYEGVIFESPECTILLETCRYL